MSDNSKFENETYIPEGSQPSFLRFVVRNKYLFVCNSLVSIAIAAMIISIGALMPREIKDRNDLKREGRVTYTNDVQVGGRRDATVFYTFTYDGKTYSSKAFIPIEYADKVLNYSKSGGFPILFLPRNPSINHPKDWTGNGPAPIHLYILVIILIVQWSRLAMYVF